MLNHYSEIDIPDNSIDQVIFKCFRIPRNEFLLRVKKAMLLVQEGVRCKSCVKINRSRDTDSQSSKFDDLVDEMSDSSYDSSYMSDSSYSLSLH